MSLNRQYVFPLIIPEVLVGLIIGVNLDLMKHNTGLFFVERKGKRGEWIKKKKAGKEVFLCDFLMGSFLLLRAI